MTDYDALNAIMNSAAVRLREHFDSVLILATRHDDPTGETVMFKTNQGNFYAVIGSAHEFMEREGARLIADESVDRDGEA